MKHTLDTDTQVFFYEQDHYYLSNFSAFRVKLLVDDGTGGEIHCTFDTSEAAYHWFKFPHLPELQAQIRAAQSAHAAFKLAEQYRERKRPDWDHIKFDVMREVLRAKVEQHEYVRRKLLETGDRELIENSWRDDVWGWGPNRDGENALGKLWMEIRRELRGVPETKSVSMADDTPPHLLAQGYRSGKSPDDSLNTSHVESNALNTADEPYCTCPDSYPGFLNHKEGCPADRVEDETSEHRHSFVMGVCSCGERSTDYLIY